MSGSILRERTGAPGHDDHGGVSAGACRPLLSQDDRPRGKPTRRRRERLSGRIVEGTPRAGGSGRYGTRSVAHGIRPPGSARVPLTTADVAHAPE